MAMKITAFFEIDGDDLKMVPSADYETKERLQRQHQGNRP